MTGQAHPRGRGRPKGSNALDTRARILAAATAEFAEVGYEAASVRGVARRAGVDPALVRHYFEDKSGLVAAVLEVPVRSERVLAGALEGPLEGAGERIVRAVLTAWDSAAIQPAGIALVRAIVSGGPTGKIVIAFFRREMLAKLAETIGGPDAQLRAELVVSQIMGLVVARYIVRFEPLASASVSELVARVGPAIQVHVGGGYPASP